MAVTGAKAKEILLGLDDGDQIWVGDNLWTSLGEEGFTVERPFGDTLSIDRNMLGVVFKKGRHTTYDVR